MIPLKMPRMHTKYINLVFSQHTYPNRNLINLQYTETENGDKISKMHLLFQEIDERKIPSTIIVYIFYSFYNNRELFSMRIGGTSSSMMARPVNRFR